MSGSEFFSDDYQTAGRRFRRVCKEYGVLATAHCCSLRGPNAEDLTTDVARVGTPEAERVVVLSSALHGVEGFFGSAVQLAVMDALVANWVGPAQRVVHLDFHTGLGPWATYRLLVDYVPSDTERTWLDDTFAADRLSDMNPHDVAYAARGGLGRWCRAQLPDIDYIELCAEFGTYPPLTMLRSLRAENQAHHWSRPPVARTHWAKRRFVETFCPASDKWRALCVRQATELVARAVVELHRGP